MRFQPSMVGAGLAMSALVLTLSGCSKQEEPVREVVRPVKLFTVEDGALADERRFPATVHSAEESQISFRIPGELIKFPVKTAELVEKGQLLAKLDDRDIKNELTLRQADFDLAQINYDRMKSLREKKVVSQSELDTISAHLKSARASLKLAKDRLEYTTLTAPFSGRIARTDVENHQFVQAQQTILLLQNSDNLDITIQMPESILTRVQEDKVDYTYQPYITFASVAGQRYPVTYKEHATSVTSGTQSYQVTFTMPVPENITVYPGMGATLHMDLRRIAASANDISGFVVPLSAVLKDDATGRVQAWVYQSETGTVQPVAITLGRVTQQGVNVLSGLNGDEQIVSAGLSHLSADMKVKPLTRERGL